jgi:Zinc metalloprotease (elastase)
LKCCIIPDDVLKKIKDKHTLENSEAIRDFRASVVLKKASKVPVPGDHDEVRVLYDAHNSLVLNEDEANIIEVDYEQEHKNVRVLYDAHNSMELNEDEANIIEVDYEQEHKNVNSSNELEMFDKTYDFFKQKLGMESYDNRDSIWKIFQHFGKQYNNAFWNGKVFVFGDADKVFFETFWIQDICTHEAMHAVTGYVTQLQYVGQSGALNEHISDVIAICLVNFLQQVGQWKWVIGEGVWTKNIKGKGLRTFTLEPAYDDPIIGRDGQPKHMKDYANLPNDKKHDMGGVHINSGILNHAFYSFVYRSGKKPFEEPLEIWWKAVQRTRAFDDFAAFAYNTIQVSGELKGHLEAAWKDVGIVPKQRKWTFLDSIKLSLSRHH